MMPAVSAAHLGVLQSDSSSFIVQPEKHAGIWMTNMDSIVSSIAKAPCLMLSSTLMPVWKKGFVSFAQPSGAPVGFL